MLHHSQYEESGNHIFQPVNASAVPLPGMATLFATGLLLVSPFNRGGAGAPPRP